MKLNIKHQPTTAWKCLKEKTRCLKDQIRCVTDQTRCLKDQIQSFKYLISNWHFSEFNEYFVSTPLKQAVIRYEGVAKSSWTNSIERVSLIFFPPFNKIIIRYTAYNKHNHMCTGAAHITHLWITTSTYFFLQVFTADFYTKAMPQNPCLESTAKPARNITVQLSLNCCLQFYKVIKALTLQLFLRSSTHLTNSTSLSLRRTTGRPLLLSSQTISLSSIYLLCHLYTSNLATKELPDFHGLNRRLTQITWKCMMVIFERHY